MIYLIKQKATKKQIKEMAKFYSGHIKLAVDIEREVLVGGGEWHADCEKILIEDGSEQSNVWGGGYNVDTEAIDFYALINIRPTQDNPDQDILAAEVRSSFARIARKLLEQ